jgi:hypothetical protein
MKEVVYGYDFLAINVNYVTNVLEGKERNPYS